MKLISAKGLKRYPITASWSTKLNLLETLWKFSTKIIIRMLSQIRRLTSSAVKVRGFFYRIGEFRPLER